MVDKHDIARILEEIGLLLELSGESPFKSRAYYNAARTIEGLTEDLGQLIATGRIREYPGIGQALTDKLAELVRTGRLASYDELKRRVPAGLIDMTAVPGLGPKKILTVWQQLGVTTVGELEYACLENRLVSLPGFGVKTQEKIRQGLLQLKKRKGYYLLASVIDEANGLVTVVRQVRGVRGAELVGDIRRRLEIVRTIDLLAAADRFASVLQAVRAFEGLADLSSSETEGRITARTSSGVPVSVSVGPEVTAHALLAATGSDAHLQDLAARAVHRHVPWNLTPQDGPPAPAAASEADLYAALGLPFIEPELREGLDEIEAIESGRMRSLVDASQIQGIFHTHTTDSDGSATLHEMVQGAKALGYRYIGISDHSQSAFYANGLKEDRIRAQHAAIEALRKTVPDITIFKGIEADILPDGTMDYADAVLATFDFVIASVHSRFNLSEEEQTQRVLKALANPHVTMLGHPTGRLLLAREGYRIDMRRVIDAACARGTVVEINANPHRLDLDWRLCRYGADRGLRVSINPDAHALEGLRDVPFGVYVARKGGLDAAQVVNTRGPDRVLHSARA